MFIPVQGNGFEGLFAPGIKGGRHAVRELPLPVDQGAVIVTGIGKIVGDEGSIPFVQQKLRVSKLLRKYLGIQFDEDLVFRVGPVIGNAAKIGDTAVQVLEKIEIAPGDGDPLGGNHFLKEIVA